MEDFELIHGDITKVKSEAIVNAANKQLKGGGGVDGAIHEAGGAVIHEQCMKIIHKKGELTTGEAVITQAGNMPSKYVIHAVGPVWNGGNDYEEVFLANAYKNVMEIVHDFNLKEIAFPNISTGIYGFPKELAAKIALSEISNFLKENELLVKVYFVCFDQENYEIYYRLMNQ